MNDSLGQVVNEETMSILITLPDPRNENVLGIGPARTRSKLAKLIKIAQLPSTVIPIESSETRGRAR